MTNSSLMKVESIEECCNTFDLHEAKIGLENDFGTSFWVAALDRCYCTLFSLSDSFI